ncbi:MarR family transcriptional regulator [Streptococcus suis]|uniref:MarR family transcriptional regulator n=1 Tax=Streptococcus TaxID=1301 RepID=UPI000CF3FCA9|nr:MarR family transcriptional regulator [Streptococcus suis]NJW37888.1 MarR family transcriptional regulator [Streptococcus suis]NQL61112.1 MarR family transcriptional regulator [Streptococcus suis]
MNKVENSLKENQHALHSLVVFRRAANTISRQETDIIRKHGLTVGQFGVMEALYNKGNLRIQDLIDKLLSTSGNMTVVIRNMVRDGYIFKTQDESDKRASLIGLTPFGRETIEKVLPEHYAHVGKIFSVLSQEEQDLLADLLKRFKFMDKNVAN